MALGYGYICEAAGSRQVYRLDFTPRFVGPQPDFFDSPFRFSQPSKPSRSVKVDSPVSLAPALFAHLDSLKSALTTIKTNEIVIAAVKARSFIPDYVVDEKYLELHPHDCWQISKMESLTVPTSRVLFSNFINTLVMKLPFESKREAFNLIRNFDFSSGSLNEFVDEKEGEIAQAYLDSTLTIRQLKTFFKSTSQNLIEPLSSALLTLVVEKLELIHDQYIQLQRSKEDLYFSDSSEVERREKYVYLRIDRVIKSVEKLAEVLEEMN